MLFNSYAFALFFAALFPAYWLLARWPRAQNVLLLGVAYYFYSRWDARFLSLLILSTVMDFACGLWVARVEDPRRRKAVVALSMALNLGMLGFFKYYNFFAESLHEALARAGLSISLGYARGRAADRHLVLHVPVDELRHRRLSPRDPADAEPGAVRGVRLVLPPPGRRADHAADHAAAPDRHARGGSTSSSSTRGPTSSSGACSRRSWWPTTWRPIVNDLFGRWQTLDGGLGAAGGLCLRLPDLRRLLGLHRHRPGRLQVPGVRADLNFNLPYFATSPRDFWTDGTSASRNG